MDCWNVAVSGDGYTYFHVCIQSVVRGVRVNKDVWTSVGVKKLLINFFYISLIQKTTRQGGRKQGGTGCWCPPTFHRPLQFVYS